ncbi:sigma-70 family RNA polymerase sigma factor [Luteolibacter pohnpeiensis]|uniref:Sigma-70 family RNA polymerase sigma factor n=1 Tax=Luteolibacter pohnpeiensis TaxID=454153 RepID=A0A934S2E4_9BACT|nr:sigma-70 family RNA polymerase sigma factor [Luteolibacter pohnpeiensis]MBK1881935.1 sigma-70 family RNA polymerase sigma factor [Luteolibacter pohnpeiensis]
MPNAFQTHLGEFHTTRWSIVIGARGQSSADVNASVDSLYRQYLSPLYAYVRRRGYSSHDAQDLTHEFFSRMLEKGWLTSAQPERGRLRTFLLVTLKRFLANEWHRISAEKRGGSSRLVSLQSEEGERLFLADASASSALPDELLFDRNWAMVLMQSTLDHLRHEYARSSRPNDFEVLKSCLTAERGSIDYAMIARELELLPVSARSVVHRFRKRFREIFREEVAGTVAAPDEVDAEMQALILTLGQR